MAKLKSVLLVDDDETTNFLNKFFIKQIDSSIVIHSVANGKEAMEFLENPDQDMEFPWLLLLDTNMPVMNGWQFLEAYETQLDERFKSNITIVMITALENEEMVRKTLANPNVKDIAQKPLSDRLFRKIFSKHF